MITRRIVNCCLRKSPTVHTSSVLKANTPIFERIHKDILPRDGIYREMDPKHDMYRVVRIERGPRNLAVILAQDSIEHGVTGEHITVPKYIGRYLIRRRIAVYPTDENIKKYQEIMMKNEQTLSGRRMLLWLRSLEVLKCPINEDVKWEMNEEIMARMLEKFHNIVCEKGTIMLPDYTIKSSSTVWNDVHEIKLKINRRDEISIKLQFVPWKPTQQ